MESAQFYIQEIIDVILKRWKLIVLFAVIIVTVVVLGTLRQPRIYQAETIVEVGAETPDIAFYKEVVSDYPQNWWTIQTYYETQYKIIMSRYMLGLAAQKIVDQKILPDAKLENVIVWLQGSIKVKPLDKSRLIAISMTDTVPGRAARISDLVADTYAEDNLNRKIKGTKEAVENLSKQLEVFKNEKEKGDQLLQKFKEENKFVILENKQNIAKQNLMVLNDTLVRIKNDRIVTEGKYKALKSIIAASGSPEKLYGAIDSELMKKLKVDYDSMAMSYGELSTRYRGKHPQIVDLKTKMDETAAAIAREANAELSKMETQYLLAKSQEDNVAVNLEKQKEEALKIDALNLKMETISSVQTTNMNVYDGLTKKLKEADLSGLVKSNNIRVMDKAVVPSYPISPKLGSNILMAIIFGIIGGIGLAYLIESMDNTIKSEDEAEKYTKAPLLGVIPLYGPKNGSDSDKSIELIPIKEPASNISELYRTIRTNLTFLSSAHGYKIFQITSAGAQDGKTTTAVNLSASMSQTGNRTLLIDLDLRKSRVSTVLGIERERGITDFLTGELPIRECIKSSGIQNLDVITTGKLPPNPAELIGSPRMKEALTELRNLYDNIVIDSSPIAPVADSTIIAQIVDAVLFVVGAEKTGRHILKSSKDQLQKVQANVLGAILNGLNVEKKKYLSKYYGYGYYRYGYSYSSDDSKDKEKGDKRIDA